MGKRTAPAGKTTICGNMIPPDLCSLERNPRADNKVCVASGEAKYFSLSTTLIALGKATIRGCYYAISGSPTDE
jgi:hypothetical protein